MDEHVMTVRELNTSVKEILESEPSLRHVLVCGEVTNCRENRFSGHWYFTLREGATKKDEYAVSCVLWKWDAARVRYKPKNGERFVVTASVTVYLNGGEYQLRVTDLSPEGLGDKERARQELIAALAEKGYFSAEHKKPLPLYPRRVGIITSGDGDAVMDVITTLKSRWPVAKVVVLPVFVQGEKAAVSIARAIVYANKWKVADELIVGRGGGSVENLDVFDDARVVQAIYDSDLPVITAVGHTKNVAIADLVADYRAITPTDAGAAAAADILQVQAALAGAGERLTMAMEHVLEHMSRRLEDLADRPALKDPEVYLAAKRMRLDYIGSNLAAAGERAVNEKRRAYVALAAKLDAMSPLKVLSRGYAVAEKDGQALRCADDAAAGDKITVRLTGGKLDCAVEEVHHDGEQ